ncbi:MAG TPA: transcription antitermination factor NusB [Pyrinomonadaceae bacterium]|nr:transcription antitermination factor NusB [Pyrinomonadaceae bacterium]
MSFEKIERAKGPRRLARECALQMLFSCDLLGAGLFDSGRYWTEFGYQEAFPEIYQTRDKIHSQIEKIKLNITDLRSIARKIEPLNPDGYSNQTTRLLVKQSEGLLSTFDNCLNLSFKNGKADLSEFEKCLNIFSGKIKSLEISQLSNQAKRSVAAVYISQNNELCRTLCATLDLIRNDLFNDIVKQIDSAYPVREFADRLTRGTLEKLEGLDRLIQSRAEHWRIERMAIVDRNILRLAVYEFLHEDTPKTVVINEALEIAREFSTYEATQFINGILDAIRLDLEKTQPASDSSDNEQNLSTANNLGTVIPCQTDTAGSEGLTTQSAAAANLTMMESKGETDPEHEAISSPPKFT